MERNNAPLAGEAPPHNFDAECFTLGSVVIESERLADIAQILVADDFYTKKHQEIYSCMLEMHEQAKPIDLLTLSNYISESCDWDSSPLSYLGNIANNTTSPRSVVNYAKIVKEKSTRRSHIAACYASIEASFKGDGAAFAESLALMRDAVDDAEMDASITSSKLEMCSGSDGFDSDVDWVIDGWVPEQSFGVTYGASGSYKSFHVIDWCCCVASNKRWSGVDVEHGAVIYIAGEGAQGIGRRVKAWEIANNAKAEHLYRPSGLNDITDPKQRSALILACQNIEENTGKKVKLIVFDTLNRFFGAGNENETKDMTAFVNACESIMRKTKCSVMPVHHTGKDQSRGGRGSSVLYAALDFEFCVQKTTDKHYKIKATKAKDSDDNNELEFSLSAINLRVKDKKGRDRFSLARKGAGFSARKVDSKIAEFVSFATSNGVREDEGVMRLHLRDTFTAMELKVKHDDSKETIHKRFGRRLNDAIANNYLTVRQDDKVYLMSSGVSDDFDSEDF